jgi:hypothetical protein
MCIAVILDLVVWYLGKDLDLYGELEEELQQKERQVAPARRTRYQIVKKTEMSVDSF